MKNTKLIAGLSSLLKVDTNVVIEALDKEDGDDSLIKAFNDKNKVYSLDDHAKLLSNTKDQVKESVIADLEKADKLPSGIYEKAKLMVMQKTERDLAKEHSVESYEGINDLVSKIAAQGKGGDGEKDAQIKQLKEIVKTKESEIEAKVKEVQERHATELTTRDLQAATNKLASIGDGEEAAVKNQIELIGGAFASKHKLALKDGKTVVLNAEGEVIRDSVMDPKPVFDVIKEFATGYGYKVKQQDPGGRGDGSSSTQTNNLKGKTFNEALESKGVKPNTDESDKLHAEWSEANK